MAQQSNQLRNSLLAVLLGLVAALMLVLNGMLTNEELALSNHEAAAQAGTSLAQAASLDFTLIALSGDWKGDYCISIPEGKFCNPVNGIWEANPASNLGIGFNGIWQSINAGLPGASAKGSWQVTTFNNLDPANTNIMGSWDGNYCDPNGACYPIDGVWDAVPLNFTAGNLPAMAKIVGTWKLLHYAGPGTLTVGGSWTTARFETKAKTGPVATPREPQPIIEPYPVEPPIKPQPIIEPYPYQLGLPGDLPQPALPPLPPVLDLSDIEDELRFIQSDIRRELDSLSQHEQFLQEELSYVTDAQLKFTLQSQLQIMQVLRSSLHQIQRDLSAFNAAATQDPWADLERTRFRIDLVRLESDFSRHTLEFQRLKTEAREYDVQLDQAGLTQLQNVFDQLSPKIDQVKASLATADLESLRRDFADLYLASDKISTGIDGLFKDLYAQLSQDSDQAGVEDFKLFYGIYEQGSQQLLSFFSELGYSTAALERAIAFPRPWLKKALVAAEAGLYEEIDYIMASMPAEELARLIGEALIPLVDPLADDFLAGKLDAQLKNLVAQARGLIEQAGETLPAELADLDLESLKEVLRPALEEVRKEYGSLGKALRVALAEEFAAGFDTLGDPNLKRFDPVTRERFDQLGLDNRESRKEWAPHAGTDEFKNFVALGDDPRFKSDVADNLAVLGGIYDPEAVNEALALKQEIFALRAELEQLKIENEQLKREFADITALASRAPLRTDLAKLIDQEIAKVNAQAAGLDEAALAALVAEVEQKVTAAISSSVEGLWQEGKVAFVDLHPDSIGDRDFAAFDSELNKIKGKLVSGVDVEGRNFNPAGNITEPEAGVIALAIKKGVAKKAELGLPQVGWEDQVEQELRALNVVSDLNPKPINRQAFFNMMVKAADLSTAGVVADCFTDVKDPALCALKNFGIIKGFADGTIKPNLPLNRAEAGLVASRLVDLIASR